MPKSENLSNTPEIRCYEDFWGLIKEEVYKYGWEAENLDQLRTIILRIIIKNTNVQYLFLLQ